MEITEVADFSSKSAPWLSTIHRVFVFNFWSRSKIKPTVLIVTSLSATKCSKGIWLKSATVRI